MGTFWRRSLRYTVTIQRETTERSASGSTKFTFADLYTGVKASIQSGGGRMRQLDVGQDPGVKHLALFGAEMMDLLRQGDLLVVEGPIEAGRKFKLYHVHNVPDPNAPHVECDIESWLPGGGD